MLEDAVFIGSGTGTFNESVLVFFKIQDVPKELLHGTSNLNTVQYSPSPIDLLILFSCAAHCNAVTKRKATKRTFSKLIF